jgi:hypothetical protein
MECKTARLLLPLLEEMAPSDAEPLLRHLGECPDCEAERQLDARIGRAMTEVPVPAGLKPRLWNALAAGRAEMMWKAVRQWAAPLAAAAAVLFLVGLAGAVLPLVNPLDADHVQWSANVTPPGSAEDADAILGRLGLPASAPRFTNYAYLAATPARAELPGYPRRQAPMLVFASGSQRASVYVIDTWRTGLKELTEPGEGYACRADIRRDPGRPRYAYLVLHTGNNYDWLEQPSE